MSQSKPLASISAIVLAGGQSRRLGKDKSLLMIEGRPLVTRTVDTLSHLSDDVVVVTNDQVRFQTLNLAARLVPDERRGVGALMGVYSGLKAARHEHALAVACDMPFLNLSLLRYMVPLATGYDVVIPVVRGFYEPLHAIYGKTCLPAMTRLLVQNRRQIIAFFPQVRVRIVTEDEIDCFDSERLSFVNINTPQDWQRVQDLLQT